MEIVNIFYNLAKQAKGVRSFRYNKGFEKGTGTDKYPMVWLDDPVLGQQASPKTVRYTVNADFLAIPEDEAQVEVVQRWALQLALAFREKIGKELTKIGSDGFSFVTLRKYYGDNAAGVRATFSLTGPLPIDLCVEFFDPNQEWPADNSLPAFNTDEADGCAVFTDKTDLPKFSVS